jgi:outer membrane lipoprotein-sorting protein
MPPRCETSWATRARACPTKPAALVALVTLALAATPLLGARADAAEPAAAASPAVPGATTSADGCGTPAQCFARMGDAQRDVARIDARFRQTKHVALMRDPLVSEGRFSFERPARVRWEMVTPEPLVVEIDGSELRAGPPGEVGKVDAGPAVALFRDLAGLFTGATDYAGDRFELAPGGTPWSFVLTPRDPSVTRVIRSIEIELDPASGGPRRVAILESGGDRTEIELLDVVVERAPDAAGSRS